MHKHVFKPSDKDGYEVCECGTYHSIAQGNPKEIYQTKEYWSHETNHSTWDEQINNLTEENTCGISKINKVLGYLPQRKPVLEIACSPGIMLKALRENGYETWGIEPNKKYADDIFHQNPHTKLIIGYFPECTKPLPPESFDYIIAMDVFEHVDDYVGFIKEVHRLLADDGKAIIMSPIILEDGETRDRDFLPYEHCWLHHIDPLRELLSKYFTKVETDRWVTGHEMIIVTKNCL